MALSQAWLLTELQSLLLLFESASYSERCTPGNTAGSVLEGHRSAGAVWRSPVICAALVKHSSVVFDVAVNGQGVLKACARKQGHLQTDCANPLDCLP